MDVIAQYLKENIAGAPPTFMKVKMAFVALAIHTLHMGSRDRSSNDATTTTRYNNEGLNFAGEAVQTKQTRLTWPASSLASGGVSVCEG
jgi:hypothetical protein